MTAWLGHPRAALIIAPHPDDEVIGAFELIRRLRRALVPVVVLIVSDGAASHPNSCAWPTRRLIAARRAESRRALARIGVDARMTRHALLPDGGLEEQAAQCRAIVSQAIRRIRHLDLLVAPVDDDAHPDHRAVAAAVADARFAGRRVGYRVWPSPVREAGGRSLVTNTIAKRSTIACHRTQLGSILDDPAGFAIARHELAAFSRPIEYYRVAR